MITIGLWSPFQTGTSLLARRSRALGRREVAQGKANHWPIHHPSSLRMASRGLWPLCPSWSNLSGECDVHPTQTQLPRGWWQDHLGSLATRHQVTYAEEASHFCQGLLYQWSIATVPEPRGACSSSLAFYTQTSILLFLHILQLYSPFFCSSYSHLLSPNPLCFPPCHLKSLVHRE